MIYLTYFNGGERGKKSNKGNICENTYLSHAVKLQQKIR